MAALSSQGHMIVISVVSHCPQYIHKSIICGTEHCFWIIVGAWLPRVHDREKETESRVLRAMRECCAVQTTCQNLVQSEGWLLPLFFTFSRCVQSLILICGTEHCLWIMVGARLPKVHALEKRRSKAGFLEQRVNFVLCEQLAKMWCSHKVGYCFCFLNIFPMCPESRSSAYICT